MIRNSSFPSVRKLCSCQPRNEWRINVSSEFSLEWNISTEKTNTVCRSSEAAPFKGPRNEIFIAKFFLNNKVYLGRRIKNPEKNPEIFLTGPWYSRFCIVNVCLRKIFVLNLFSSGRGTNLKFFWDISQIKKKYFSA